MLKTSGLFDAFINKIDAIDWLIGLPEIVDHEEAVDGLHVAVAPREPAGDQVVTVHVEVGQRPAVRL